MIYTDTEAWGDDMRVCLFPDASGEDSTAWCGSITPTDSLTACNVLADSLEKYLRQEGSQLCDSCVNEMCRDLGIPDEQRRRWVEDYANGVLADHAKP